jgi:hypothetical protein
MREMRMPFLATVALLALTAAAQTAEPATTRITIDGMT